MTLRTTRAARWTLSGVLAIFLLSIPLAAQTPGLVGNPSPANGAVGVPTAVALSWSAATDARRYDVRLGTTASPPVVARNVNGTT